MTPTGSTGSVAGQTALDLVHLLLQVEDAQLGDVDIGRPDLIQQLGQLEPANSLPVVQVDAGRLARPGDRRPAKSRRLDLPVGADRAAGAGCDGGPSALIPQPVRQVGIVAVHHPPQQRPVDQVGVLGRGLDQRQLRQGADLARDARC